MHLTAIWYTHFSNAKRNMFKTVIHAEYSLLPPADHIQVYPPPPTTTITVLLVDQNQVTTLLSPHLWVVCHYSSSRPDPGDHPASLPHLWLVCRCSSSSVAARRNWRCMRDSSVLGLQLSRLLCSALFPSLSEAPGTSSRLARTAPMSFQSKCAMALWQTVQHCCAKKLPLTALKYLSLQSKCVMPCSKRFSAAVERNYHLQHSNIYLCSQSAPWPCGKQFSIAVQRNYH